MTELCRVLVADDDPMVREAYRMFLTRNDNHEVVGEARNGREAVEAYEELKPDVVLMDLQMPDMSGVDAIRESNRKHRGACIVALTTCGATRRRLRIPDEGLRRTRIADRHPAGP